MTVERVHLANGLTLLTEAVHDAPVIALQAWVGVGSADEDEAEAGVAHLHEHMLFKGTASRGVGEIARAVEAAGGEINAWTSYDQTVYHLVLAASELELGLDVLADAVRDSSFEPEELAREIEVVLEEIKRADDVPARRVSKALFGLAYERHPYRRPVLGTEATVRGLTRERVLAFYHAYYRPARTTLVAVGDFDVAVLRAGVERAFGGWSHDGPGEPARRPVESSPAAVRLKVLREDVKETRLALAWHVPGLEHPDAAALDVLAVALGHGDSSRLFRETRRRRELVNDVYAYAYTPRDPGLLMIGAGLRADGLTAALSSVLDEAYGLREHLLGEDELEKAKVVITSDTAYQRETVQGEARRLGYYEVVAGDHAYEERYREALERLTPRDVREAARRYLTATPAIVAQVPVGDGTPEERVLALVGERFARAAGRRWTPRGGGEVDRVVLDNGAVILVRETSAPIVAVRALALGGLRWETRDTAGLGTLFSSLWGLATEELGPESLAQRVALLGGSIGAFSGRNTLGLRGEFVAARAVEGLELFCDALLRPLFHDGDLARERTVLLERVRTREDNAAAVAFELFAETLYPTHPYGLRMGGTEETLARLRLADMHDHRSRFVTPDKLVVAVVGGIDAARAVDLLRRELEAGEGAPLPPVPAADPQPDAPRAAYYRLDRRQTHVVVGGMGATVFHEDRYALEVLTTILSGQSGRLFLDLRDRQSLAYSVSSSSLEGLDPGHVVIHVATSPEKLEQALAGLLGHLEDLRRAPPTAEELERARRFLVGAHAIELQRAGARAMLNALGERFGQGHDDYQRYPDRIRAVTGARVHEVAARYLAPERLVRVIVGPQELRGS